MSDRPRRLLFVCTGNICRSLMAERMALKIARERGLPLEAKSCGIAAESFYRPPEEIHEALSALGLDCAGHAPQLVSRDLLRWCDAALTMTRQHKEHVLELYPEFRGKVHLLRSYAGETEGDVADPMGRTQPVYDACRDELWKLVGRLFERAA